MDGHDHSGMGHGGMGHGGMEMPSKGAMCNMNMLFTWDTTNLCIVFRQWHVYSTFGLIASLFGVVLLTAGYELVREASRRYEASSAEYMNKLPRNGEAKPVAVKDDEDGERSSLLWLGQRAGNAEKQVKVVKALFYAVQVFYSFFIMLLFMTYNGWVMLAVALGAFVGYLVFGDSSPTKSVACH